MHAWGHALISDSPPYHILGPPASAGPETRSRRAGWRPGNRDPAASIFEPYELPMIASQAGRALRDLRRIAEGAMNDLREGLGPELADFEIEDLNPRRFVQTPLFDDLNAEQGARQPTREVTANALRAPGERPPFDPDAT
jgi:sec-independent protein translocase protein TatB